VASGSHSKDPVKRDREAFTVRRGTVRDIPLLMRHRLSMQRELRRGSRLGIVAFERDYRSWMSKRMRARRLIPFIAECREGRSVGSGSIWLREDRPHQGVRGGLTPRVHGIYVEPAARRQGVATELLRAMLRWIRAHGYRRANLRSTRRAAALYARYGFRPSSEMVWEGK
jgi:GNAT superfamily N-acetyltransferase